jgi:hypothetical protein
MKIGGFAFKIYSVSVISMVAPMVILDSIGQILRSVEKTTQITPYLTGIIVL